MVFLTTDDGFNAAVGVVTPVLVLFAGRWSVLGGNVVAKMVMLNPTKVTIYQVDIDSSEGAQLAMNLSVRESPTVILFVAGVPKVRANDLTDEMIKMVVS